MKVIITNLYQIAGRIISVCAPAAAIGFLSNDSYVPVTDLGTIGAWGLGQLPNYIGDRKHEKSLDNKILKNEGIDKALKRICGLPYDELACMIGKAEKSRKQYE